MKKSTLSKFAVLGLGYAVMREAFSNKIKVNFYRYKSSKITENIRIVFLSDLHNNNFGTGQKDLIEIIDNQRPDLVLLGGDIFDRRASIKPCLDLLSWLGKNYLTYYVTGNHEYRLGKIKDIKELVSLLNVNVLEGDSVAINKGTLNMMVHGVDDYKARSAYRQQMKTIGQNLNKKYYNILLTHRPERVQDYNQFSFDLILAGHAHGGQMRIPGIMEGLYAPHQGFFPNYIRGEYLLANGSTMLVSQGLGYQHYRVPRVFNRPEVIVIDFDKQ